MAYSDQEIKDKLQSVIGWEFQSNTIQKTYRFPDTLKALDFINKLSMVAEHYSHYPEINLKFNQVKVVLGTEEQDFTIIREAEKVAVEMI